MPVLSAIDKAIKLVSRFAGCSSDARDADSIEHKVERLIGQRVFGITFSNPDLNDHDELRYDPVMAVLVGKLKARRKKCAPAADKSTPPPGLSMRPKRA